MKAILGISSISFASISNDYINLPAKSHYSSNNPSDMQELNVPEKDVEELLVSLILDNRIHGHIDQVNRLLERGDRFAFQFLHDLIIYFSSIYALYIFLVEDI